MPRSAPKDGTSSTQEVDAILNSGWPHSLFAKQKKAARALVQLDARYIEILAVVRSAVHDGCLDRMLMLRSRHMAPRVGIAPKQMVGLLSCLKQPQLTTSAHPSCEGKTSIIMAAVAAVAAVDSFDAYERTQRCARALVVGVVLKGMDVPSLLGARSGSMLRVLCDPRRTLVDVDRDVAAAVERLTLTTRFQLMSFEAHVVEGLQTARAVPMGANGFGRAAILAVLDGWKYSGGASGMIGLRVDAYLPNADVAALASLVDTTLVGKDIQGAGSRFGAAYWHAYHTDPGRAHAWRAAGHVKLKAQLQEHIRDSWADEKDFSARFVPMLIEVLTVVLVSPEYVRLFVPSHLDALGLAKNTQPYAVMAAGHYSLAATQVTRSRAEAWLCDETFRVIMTDAAMRLPNDTMVGGRYKLRDDAGSLVPGALVTKPFTADRDHLVMASTVQVIEFGSAECSSYRVTHRPLLAPGLAAHLCSDTVAKTLTWFAASRKRSVDGSPRTSAPLALVLLPLSPSAEALRTLSPAPMPVAANASKPSRGVASASRGGNSGVNVAVAPANRFELAKSPCTEPRPFPYRGDGFQTAKELVLRAEATHRELQARKRDWRDDEASRRVCAIHFPERGDDDGEWLYGRIESFSHGFGTHLVVFDNGEQRNFNLQREIVAERFVFLSNKLYPNPADYCEVERIQDAQMLPALMTVHSRASVMALDDDGMHVGRLGSWDTSVALLQRICERVWDAGTLVEEAAPDCCDLTLSDGLLLLCHYDGELNTLCTLHGQGHTKSRGNGSIWAPLMRALVQSWPCRISRRVNGLLCTSWRIVGVRSVLSGRRMAQLAEAAARPPAALQTERFYSRLHRCVLDAVEVVLLAAVRSGVRLTASSLSKIATSALDKPTSLMIPFNPVMVVALAHLVFDREAVGLGSQQSGVHGPRWKERADWPARRPATHKSLAVAGLGSRDAFIAAAAARDEIVLPTTPPAVALDSIGGGGAQLALNSISAHVDSFDAVVEMLLRKTIAADVKQKWLQRLAAQKGEVATHVAICLSFTLALDNTALTPSVCNSLTGGDLLVFTDPKALTAPEMAILKAGPGDDDATAGKYHAARTKELQAERTAERIASRPEPPASLPSQLPWRFGHAAVGEYSRFAHKVLLTARRTPSTPAATPASDPSLTPSRDTGFRVAAVPAETQRTLGPRIASFGRLWVRGGTRRRQGLKNPTSNKRDVPGTETWNGGPSTSQEATASLAAWIFVLRSGAVATIEDITDGLLQTFDPDTDAISRVSALFMRSGSMEMEDSLRKCHPEMAAVLDDCFTMVDGLLLHMAPQEAAYLRRLPCAREDGSVWVNHVLLEPSTEYVAYLQKTCGTQRVKLLAPSVVGGETIVSLCVRDAGRITFNRTLNVVHTILNGLELVRLSWVMQIHGGALEMVLLALLYPRMAVVHSAALRSYYASGKLMLPNAFIATFTGRLRDKDNSGSLCASKSNLWKVKDGGAQLKQAIEHPTNRAKVIDYIAQCERDGNAPEKARRPSYYKVHGQPRP